MNHENPTFDFDVIELPKLTDMDPLFMTQSEGRFDLFDDNSNDRSVPRAFPSAASYTGVRQSTINFSRLIVDSTLKIMGASIGVIQSIAFLMILGVVGSFYRTGIKGFIIDKFILVEDFCTPAVQKYTTQQVNAKKDPLFSNAEEIDFKGDTTYKGIHFQHNDARVANKTVIYIPGMCGSYQTSIETIKKIHNTGFDVLSVNHSGIGGSEPLDTHHTIDTLVEPIKLAIDHLKSQRVKAEDIILWGHSYGGGLAAETAKQVDDEVTVILDRTFNSFAEAANHTNIFVFYPFNRLLAALVYWTTPLDTEEALGHVKGKVTIVYSENDEVIKIPASAMQCKKSDDQRGLISQPKDAIKEEYALYLGNTFDKFHSTPWRTDTIRGILGKHLKVVVPERLFAKEKLEK